MTELTWRGERADGETSVKVSADEHLWANLPLYLDEVNHASEFNWGYWGSGSAQLAYAILRMHFEIIGDYSTDTARQCAEKYYQEFKVEFVSSWRNDVWSLSSYEIEKWLYGEEEW
jgi:hypothetical protein